MTPHRVFIDMSPCSVSAVLRKFLKTGFVSIWSMKSETLRPRAGRIVSHDAGGNGSSSPREELGIKATKRLIEVALPLTAINKSGAREKSIRHGHPSLLHMGCAQRPQSATQTH